MFANKKFNKHLNNTFVRAFNKSSAVAGMGDPLVIIDVVRKVGATVPLSVGS